MPDTQDPSVTTQTTVTETGAPAGEGAAQVVSTETVTAQDVADHKARLADGATLAEAAGEQILGSVFDQVRDRIMAAELPTEEYVVLTPIRFSVARPAIEPGTRLALTAIEAAELLATGAIGRIGAGVVAGPAVLGARLFGRALATGEAALGQVPPNPALQTADQLVSNQTLLRDPALGPGRPLR